MEMPLVASELEEKLVIKCEYSSKAINDSDNDKSCHARKNNPNTSVLKKAPSVGKNSSLSGKKMVWRVAGSNNTCEGTKPLKVETNQLALSSSVPKENCVWRIVGSNGTSNVTKPLKVKGNNFSVPSNVSQGSLIGRDSCSDFSETSSSTNNASSEDDMEMLLFEMLGRGFQLERSTIREVLGNCGYDMKKSVEALLDISALQLDRRNNFSEIKHLHCNSKILISENQKQKGNYSERQPKLGLLNVPVSKTIASSNMEDEMERDNAKNLKPEATTPNVDDTKDVVEEGSYYILRKAVKEHRETMKEYYNAAAEAFAVGDRDRAVSLLEKGQVFHSLAREADEESVSKLFETSSDRGDGNEEDEMSLNLQDYDPKEAISLVKIHLRTLSGIPYVRDLKINIGKEGQYVEKRKRLILRLFDKEGIKWIEDENSSTILVHLDEINPKNLSFGK